MHLSPCMQTLPDVSLFLNTNLFVGGMSARDQTPVLSFNSLFVFTADVPDIQTQTS